MTIIKIFILLLLAVSLLARAETSCTFISRDSDTALLGKRFHYTFSCWVEPVQAFYCTVNSLPTTSSNSLPSSPSPLDPASLTIYTADTIDKTAYISYRTDPVFNVGLINMVYFLPVGTTGQNMEFGLEVNSNADNMKVSCKNYNDSISRTAFL